MMPPSDCVQIALLDQIDIGGEWMVWCDDDVEHVSWHTSVEHQDSGCWFAILPLTTDRPRDVDVYAVFIGVSEERDLPSSDQITSIGKAALAVFYDFWHEKHPDDYSDLPEDDPRRINYVPPRVQ